MTNRRLLPIALAAIATVITSSSAFAYGGRCAAAREELRLAQETFDRAEWMVFNNASVCPGGWDFNAGCMLFVANNYNDAKVRLERAHRFLHRACR
jgi:hypothetical protein